MRVPFPSELQWLPSPRLIVSRDSATKAFLTSLPPPSFSPRSPSILQIKSRKGGKDAWKEQWKHVESALWSLLLHRVRSFYFRCIGEGRGKKWKAWSKTKPLAGQTTENYGDLCKRQKGLYFIVHISEIPSPSATFPPKKNPCHTLFWTKTPFPSLYQWGKNVRKTADFRFHDTLFSKPFKISPICLFI